MNKRALHVSILLAAFTGGQAFGLQAIPIMMGLYLIGFCLWEVWRQKK